MENQLKLSTVESRGKKDLDFRQRMDTARGDSRLSSMGVHTTNDEWREAGFRYDLWERSDCSSCGVNVDNLIDCLSDEKIADGEFHQVSLCGNCIAKAMEMLESKEHNEP